MLVVGGPSGAGKSYRFPVEQSGYPFFNVDDWIRDNLNEGEYHGFTTEMRRAGLDACAAWARERISVGESLAVEASLRRDETFDLVRAARERGFLTQLRFIALDLPEAIRRVVARRHGGGHGADVEKLEDIHRGSLQNLGRAIRDFERVEVYDNSGPPDKPAVLVLVAGAGAVRSVDPVVPGWLRAALAGTEYAKALR